DRIQRLRAASDDVFDFLRRAVVNADIVLGLDQTAGHGLSHAAKPNESDLHADSLLLRGGILQARIRRLEAAAALGQKQPRVVQEPMSAMSQKRTFARVAMFYSVLNGLLVLGHRSLPWQTSPQKSKSAVLMKMATPLAAATGLPLKRFTSHFLTAPRVRPRLATPRRLHSPKLSCRNSIAKDAEWASVSSRVA